MHITNIIQQVHSIFRRVGCGLIFAYSNTAHNVYIVSVTKNSPADNAGLMKEDIILSINNTALSFTTLEEFLTWHKTIYQPLHIGDQINIRLQNKQGIKEVECIAKKTNSFFPVLRCFFYNIRKYVRFYGMAYDTSTNKIVTFYPEKHPVSDDDVDDILL